MQSDDAGETRTCTEPGGSKRACVGRLACDWQRHSNELLEARQGVRLSRCVRERGRRGGRHHEKGEELLLLRRWQASTWTGAAWRRPRPRRCLPQSEQGAVGRGQSGPPEQPGRRTKQSCPWSNREPIFDDQSIWGEKKCTQKSVPTGRGCVKGCAGRSGEAATGRTFRLRSGS